MVHDYQLKIVRWCTKPAILFWPWTFVEKETPLQQQMKEILTLQLTISFILPKATMPVGHPIPEQYFLLLTFYLEWYVHTWTWKNAVGPILYKFGPFLWLSPIKRDASCFLQFKKTFFISFMKAQLNTAFNCTTKQIVFNCTSK